MSQATQEAYRTGAATCPDCYGCRREVIYRTTARGTVVVDHAHHPCPTCRPGARCYTCNPGPTPFDRQLEATAALADVYRNLRRISAEEKATRYRLTQETP